MIDLIKTLKESDNPVLVAAAKNLPYWSKLKHKKSDLEFLLKFNIVKLQFLPKSDTEYHYIICTSNVPFIQIYNLAKKREKLKAANIENTGIQTKNKDSILTYDLIDGTYKTIMLTDWRILEFITMPDKENLLILDTIIHECLNRNHIK